jgi:hypothetical protein
MTMAERCVQRNGESVIGQVELSELLKELSSTNIEEKWETIGTR